MNVIHLGLIGAGMRLRLVVRQLLELTGDRVRVHAVCDPDAGALEEVRREFGDRVVVSRSVEELVALPEISWVFIGSFNCDHAAHALLALRAGKHVFCEKPLATTLKDCLAVREEVRRSGKTFAFGLVLRYSPHYQKIYEIVRSGVLGKIISFEFNETLRFDHGGFIFGNWRRERKVAGSHILEKCCHDLDLANWIVGSLPVKAASFGGRDFFLPGNAARVEAVGRDSEGKQAYMAWPDPHRVNPFTARADIFDNQVVILEYASGARATFHTDGNCALPERRFYISGTEGCLRADAYTGVIELKKIGYDTKTESIPTGSGDDHAGGDEMMAEGLARTLLDGAPPLASVEEGITACIVAFGIDQAADENKVVSLEPLWKAAGISPA